VFAREFVQKPGHLLYMGFITKKLQYYTVSEVATD